MSDQTMTIGDRELQRIGEYVKGNLREWLDQVAPHSVVTTQLLERSVRIEEELHAQREIMQVRFEAADRRFEDMNNRFEDMNVRFGDMNIFHRIDQANKTVQFSVASAVEPGTFDLSAMAEFSTLGITMFLRLPGLDEPLPVFDDMLGVARDIASSLGGDLKDEQLSVMTGQTSEHCRQRIAEFSRKRMSQRA